MRDNEAVKTCTKCEKIKWEKEFAHRSPMSYRKECKACFNAMRDTRRDKDRDYYVSNIGKFLLANAKRRADTNGVEFNITQSDILPLPSVCPYLGIEIKLSEEANKRMSTPNSPSVDRIDPNKGYVKGNVLVVSYRGNTLKNNATPEELFTLATNLQRLRPTFA